MLTISQEWDWIELSYILAQELKFFAIALRVYYE